MKRKRKVIIFLVASLVASIMLWRYLGRLVFESVVLPAENRKVNEYIIKANEDIRKHLPTFHQELAQQIEALPFLFHYENKKNIGGYLNPRWEWRGAEPYYERFKGRVGNGELKLTAAVTALLHQAKENWMQIKPDQLNAVDDSWMEILPNYDHWNIETDSPIAEAIKAGIYNPLLQPEPTYGLSEDWVKISLLKSKALKTSDAAIPKCLHLAKLVFSTEGSLLSSVIALRIVNHVKNFYTTYPKRFAKSYPFLMTFDKEYIERVKRIHLFSAQAFNPIVEPTLMTITFAVDSIYRCSGLQESAWNVLFARSAQAPISKEWLQAATDILTNTKACRLNSLRQAWILEKLNPNSFVKADLAAKSKSLNRAGWEAFFLSVQGSPPYS